MCSTAAPRTWRLASRLNQLSQGAHGLSSTTKDAAAHARHLPQSVQQRIQVAHRRRLRCQIGQAVHDQGVQPVTLHQVAEQLDRLTPGWGRPTSQWSRSTPQRAT